MGENGQNSHCVLSQKERCPTGMPSSRCRVCHTRLELVSEGKSNVEYTKEDIRQIIYILLVEMVTNVGPQPHDHASRGLSETIQVFMRLIDNKDPIIIEAIERVAFKIELKKDSDKVALAHLY